MKPKPDSIRFKGKAAHEAFRAFAAATHQLESGPSSIHGDYMLTEKSAKKLLGEEPKSGYQEAKDFIEALPMSWYPALLLHMAECAYRKKVFRRGGASRIVAQWEEAREKPDITWIVEYEIPPLRAIYHAECDAMDEASVRGAVTEKAPLWRIRKITRKL